MQIPPPSSGTSNARTASTCSRMQSRRSSRRQKLESSTSSLSPTEKNAALKVYFEYSSVERADCHLLSTNRRGDHRHVKCSSSSQPYHDSNSIHSDNSRAICLSAFWQRYRAAVISPATLHRYFG